MKARPQDVINAVCSVFEVNREQLLNATRGEFRIAFARQAAMMLCRELTSLSLQRVGNQLGRDHSTVYHAIKMVAYRLKDDPSLQANLDLCRAHVAAVTQTRARNISEALARPLFLEAAE